MELVRCFDGLSAVKLSQLFFVASEYCGPEADLIKKLEEIVAIVEKPYRPST